MAFHFRREVTWQAGVGSLPKYSVTFEGECELTSISTEEGKATFSLYASAGITNYPNQSRNSFAASDFATLSVAGYDPADYQFTKGVSYYKGALPALPNAPQSYLDNLLAEFRGDTYISDGPNCVSFWTKDRGLVMDRYSGSEIYIQPILTTFELKLTGDPSQPVLIYNHSGCNSSTDYSWLQHEVWATLLDFDYRPGMTWDGTNWMSHNRDGGVCNVYQNGDWQEMRTEGYPDAKGDPPLLYRDGGLWNMARIGEE